eukprot:1157574-Pelagomonas_calceolata.AAC.17
MLGLRVCLPRFPCSPAPLPTSPDCRDCNLERQSASPEVGPEGDTEGRVTELPPLPCTEVKLPMSRASCR